MKKILIPIILLIAIAFAISGCAGNSTSSGLPDNSTAVSEASTEASPSQENTTAAPEEKNGETTGNTTEVASAKVQDSMAAVKIDTGVYDGQIDSSSIEIKISGLPEDKAIRAFRLNDKVKEGFDNYGLNSGDVIKVTYTLNEYDQPVISDIEILNKAAGN